MAISNASVTDYARGREAARLLSRLAMIGGVAPIIAPLIGGQLLRVVLVAGPVLRTDRHRRSRCSSPCSPASPRACRASGGPRPASAPSSGACSRSAATSGFLGLGAHQRVQLRRVLRLSGRLVVRLPGGVRRLAGGVQRAVRRQRRRHARGQRPEPPAARPLLAAATAWPRPSSSISPPGRGRSCVLLAGGLADLGARGPTVRARRQRGPHHPELHGAGPLAPSGAAGTASAFFGTLRLGLGALATPLVGLAGGLDGVSMGLVIAGAGALALATFTVVLWRDREPRTKSLRVPPGTCADMTVC